MLYGQSTAKRHIRANDNVFLSQVKILIHNLIHVSAVEDWRNLVEMKLNEPGRQKLGLSCQKQDKLRKREALIALGSHAGERLTFQWPLVFRDSGSRLWSSVRGGKTKTNKTPMRVGGGGNSAIYVPGRGIGTRKPELTLCGWRGYKPSIDKQTFKNG